MCHTQLSQSHSDSCPIGSLLLMYRHFIDTSAGMNGTFRDLSRIKHYDFYVFALGFGRVFFFLVLAFPGVLGHFSACFSISERKFPPLRRRHSVSLITTPECGSLYFIPRTMMEEYGTRRKAICAFSLVN